MITSLTLAIGVSREEFVGVVDTVGELTGGVVPTGVFPASTTMGVLAVGLARGVKSADCTVMAAAVMICS